MLPIVKTKIVNIHFSATILTKVFEKSFIGSLCMFFRNVFYLKEGASNGTGNFTGNQKFHPLLNHEI